MLIIALIVCVEKNVFNPLIHEFRVQRNVSYVVLPTCSGNVNPHPHSYKAKRPKTPMAPTKPAPNTAVGPAAPPFEVEVLVTVVVAAVEPVLLVDPVPVDPAVLPLPVEAPPTTPPAPVVVAEVDPLCAELAVV